MPKISIIVPIYNTEKYLSACINSVLFQTFDDFELLLINDGSTDDSEKICCEYVSRDSRVKLFNKDNGGQPSALNYGIEQSVGEYLMFLDADDYWCDNNILGKLYNVAKLYDLDVVRGECQEVNNEGEILYTYLTGEYKKNYAYKIVDSVFFIDKIVDGKYFMVLYLIRRAALGDIRYNINRVFLQDAELNLTLCSQNLKCMYVPEVFYAYRKHDGAITVRPHPQKLYDAFDFSRFCFQLAENTDNEDVRKFCIKEGVRNYMFDLNVIAELDWTWSEMLNAIDIYKLYQIRNQIVEYYKRNSSSVRYGCTLPPIFIIFYYKLKTYLRVLYRKLFR